MNNGNFLRSRRFKYGSVAILVTIFFIAAVIIVNVIFTALSDKYLWYIDMSPDQVFTVSDASKELLKDLDKEVKIIFCNDPDQLDESAATQYVHALAKDYAKNFDNITIEYINIFKDYSATQKYRTTSGSTIYSTSVIIESGTEFRVFGIKAFFVFNDSDEDWAYNGEKKITSAILSVTQTDMPVAQFVTNHGETFPQGLIDLVETAGYEIKQLDLTTDTIDPDCRLIIVSNPVSDFIVKSTVSDVSEIEKLDKYLAEFGTLMVFMNPDSKKLDNFEEYLAEWGISYERGYIKDASQSISSDGYSVVAEYTTEGLGASVHSDLRNLPSPPKVIFYHAMPIRSLYDSSGSYYSNGVSRDISNVFESSSKAQLYENGTLVESASDLNKFALMTITRETTIVNNESYYSYVIACGTPYFGADTFTESTTYGNSEVLYALMRATGKENVPAGIDLIPYADYTIEDMTTSEANAWTAALILVLPVVLLGVCAVVMVRRKHV